MRKNTNIIQDSQSLGTDFKNGSRECESGVPTTGPRRLVIMISAD